MMFRIDFELVNDLFDFCWTSYSIFGSIFYFLFHVSYHVYGLSNVLVIDDKQILFSLSNYASFTSLALIDIGF